MLKLRFAQYSLLSLLLTLVIPPSYAESSTGIRLGETDFGGKRSSTLGTQRSVDSQPKPLGDFNRHHTERRDYKYRDHSRSDGYKKHHKPQPSYGISGHPSYGLNSNYHHHKHPHNYNQRRYRDYHHDPRGLSAYYSYKDRVGLSFYSAPVSSYSYAYSASPIGLSDSRYQPYSYAEKNSEKNAIDPWQALGNYQIDTARYAFQSQIQQQPNAALPLVGYALSKALAGQIEAGAYLMENALLSNVSDLRYFNSAADPDLQLVIAELLLSYPDDPFMSASLYFLNRDYHAANQALKRAQQRCEQCPAIGKLAMLIEQHP
jgi:hypothetical protein